MSEIHFSTRRGEWRTLRKYLRQGGDPDSRGGSLSYTLMNQAMECDSPRVKYCLCKLLLEYGADVNRSLWLGSRECVPTPFWGTSDMKLCKLFIAYGADLSDNPKQTKILKEHYGILGCFNNRKLISLCKEEVLDGKCIWRPRSRPRCCTCCCGCDCDYDYDCGCGCSPCRPCRPCKEGEEVKCDGCIAKKKRKEAEADVEANEKSLKEIQLSTAEWKERSAKAEAILKESQVSLAKLTADDKKEVKKAKKEVKVAKKK